MVSSGPRIHPDLVRVLMRIDDTTVPIAEVYRRLGAEADRRGITRPSYERVRELIHIARDLRNERRGPSTLQLLWEGGAALRPGRNVIDQMTRPREERR